jgi:PAS domain S-box-containing protein
MIELLNKDRTTFERLLDLLPDSILAIDADGRILFANEHLVRLFGYSRSELAGQAIEILVPGNLVAEHKRHRAAYFASPHVRPIGTGLELNGRKKDGTEFPVDISLSPIITQEGLVVVAAIRDHTVHSQAQKEIAVRAAQQAAITELALQAQKDGDLSDLLELATTEVARTLGVEFGGIFELLPGGSRFLISGAYGWKTDSRGATLAVSPEVMTGYTLANRDLFVTPDFGRETRFDREPLLVEHGVSSGICVYMSGDANPWGVLGLFSCRPRSFTVDEAHFIRTFASLLASVLQRKLAGEEVRKSREQLRALTLRLQAVQEEEQKRIAREIHDELGQSLTVLKFDLAFLSGQFSGAVRVNQRRGFLSHVQALETSVDKTIQLMREIAATLRPSVLDDLGLAAALEWQAEEFRARTGIRTDLDLSASPSATDPNHATAVFRITQEALTNVARHAAATHVAITLRETETGLVLTVQDNGRGVSERDMARPNAFGLLGMRERAESIGALLRIHGSPGHGTTVTLRVPRVFSVGQAV